MMTPVTDMTSEPPWVPGGDGLENLLDHLVDTAAVPQSADSGLTNKLDRLLEDLGHTVEKAGQHDTVLEDVVDRLTDLQDGAQNALQQRQRHRDRNQQQQCQD